MASSRDTVSIETLFSVELLPHPTALFDYNGEMRKTSKSVLKKKLQVVCGMWNRQLPKAIKPLKFYMWFLTGTTK